MHRNKTAYRKKIMVFMIVVVAIVLFLIGRLVYLMIFCSEYYGRKAEDLHERERDIKAARGEIIDRNGVVLAENKTVCTISVIHSQVKEPELVISMLAKELEMDEAEVRKRVEKVSSIERIKTNVDKKTGDAIRAYGYAGVKIDEDYKRYYPYDTLASKVLGFTGGDNQGIVGLEVKYDKYLQGENGKILTLTDARGVEIENAGERRQEPVDGNDLHISLDYNIQMYAEQAAKKAMEEHRAERVSVLMMNPQNGEILAMVNVPEFNLNEPFTINGEVQTNQDKLNTMWRNACINDTYEPGSTFKIITASAALEEGVVTLEDKFNCPGYKIVEDRKIRCAKVGGHGQEDFTQGIMNSCNPVFIELGLRLGSEKYYSYFKKFGLLQKTNVDLPGEAATIMHNPKNIGQVELATISFGQSFQITPIQLATTVSSIINGGNRITPHLGLYVTDEEGKTAKTFQYETQEGIVSEKTSETMKMLLEKVVSEGGGKNAAIEGFSIGGKTATSQTLPRSANKYISSFLGFAPADDPQVLALVIIHDPKGVYYGGTIAAPVVKDIFENVLPYLGIEGK
ncbi:MAG: penicillin-binding transpeptidase domain-containing protein [Lachnospiraceae bacterium]|nr:peptidoglycan glycosyltransferase [Lachnospiraceae bacterium]MDD7379110.1 penicillin-binding transpeptidase domain-containing protein [Lachnospiraceae bacterium]MDY4617176.1 penicillin-binding transpeptidase domain-containing protein [Lachnospiraceae bacterium]